MQLVELDRHGLEERGEGDRLLDPHRHVADAELEGVEERVRADVPPDLLAVVDAVGLDQQLDVVVVLGEAAEVVRDAGAREAVEDHAAVRLEAGVAALPEGRVGGQREEVRQEVARLVHDVDRRLAVVDADVDVQAEDQVRPRHLLQVFDDLLVARRWR